jgi:hypothetical protein
LNSIARVMQAIRHQPAAPVPRGELVLGGRIVRAILCAQARGAGAAVRSDTDRVIACCKVLALDLVCLPAAEADRVFGAVS